LPREGDAIVLPSRGGGLDGLTASLADVASKIDKIPFEEIGDNANATLAKAERLVTDIDTNAAPALAQLPMIAAELSEAAKNARGALGSDGYGQNSEFQRGLARLLHEADDTARSVRTLADFLDRHPESLLRGRAGQGGR
jgi:paraquat-inducible protein B